MGKKANAMQVTKETGVGEVSSDFLGNDGLEAQGHRADTEPPPAKEDAGPLDTKTMVRRCGLVLERGSESDRKRAVRALVALWGEES